jgi:microcystin-dependent protein
VGSGQAHDNMAPFLVVNFAIAMTGIFPTRS